MMTEFLVNDVIGHKTLGMGSPYVDGFYIDDEVHCRLQVTQIRCHPLTPPAIRL